MTHENVISTRLLSDVSCNRTLRTVAMRRRGQRMNFFSCGAWRAPGGRVWLPPKSFVLPPKSIMPLRSRRISGSLYNDMLVLSRKMDLHETVSLFPKKKKIIFSPCVVSFRHIDRQPSNLSGASSSEALQKTAFTGEVERVCKQNVCKS